MGYKRCNGYKDCPSGNDEEGCPETTGTSLIFNNRNGNAARFEPLIESGFMYLIRGPRVRRCSFVSFQLVERCGGSVALRIKLLIRPCDLNLRFVPGTVDGLLQ